MFKQNLTKTTFYRLIASLFAVLFIILVGYFNYLVAEIPKKVRELAEILGMEPELFPKSVPS